MGFLEVNDTTGQGLFDVLQDELKKLDLDIDDVRGQGYDNGSKELSILLAAVILSDFNVADIYFIYNIFFFQFQVSDSDNDPKITSEVLYAVNSVSKHLQAKDMLIDGNRFFDENPDDTNRTQSAEEKLFGFLFTSEIDRLIYYNNKSI
ncbi:hypothetical protein ACJX0J_017629 [Zea mays]